MKVVVEKRAKVKSRKVNKYVNLILTSQALHRELIACETAVKLYEATLTGGQLSEGQKIVNDPS